MSTWRRALMPLAVATLLVAACGRSDDGGGEAGETATTQAAAVEEGPATGTISVWAMGTEGDNLGVLGDAFTAENPEPPSRRPRCRGTPPTTGSRRPWRGSRPLTTA